MRRTRGYFKVSSSLEILSLAKGMLNSLLVRLPRVQLLQEQIQKPVPPPVTAKQYVVSADRNSMSADEHSAERELFWYREELFKSLNLSWKEVRRPSLL